MDKKEIRKMSAEFAKRVNEINTLLRGAYDNDSNYFDDCSFLPANHYKDRYTGELVATETYVIRGRHHHYFCKFDHNPSDKEINNALVRGFNLNSSFLIK